MEQVDDRHYLTDPSDVEECEVHGKPKPCPDCKADMEEWRYEAWKETR